MKKTLLIIGILLSMMTVNAQRSVKVTIGSLDADAKLDSLEVFNAFDSLKNQKNAVYVELFSGTFESYDVEVFKALTVEDYEGNYSLIQECLNIDKKKCKKVKEINSDGKVISAYYQLPDTEEDMNSFILYKCKKSDDELKHTLIYLKGDLDSDDLVSLLFTMKAF